MKADPQLEIRLAVTVFKFDWEMILDLSPVYTRGPKYQSGFCLDSKFSTYDRVPQIQLPVLAWKLNFRSQTLAESLTFEVSQ